MMKYKNKNIPVRHALRSVLTLLGAAWLLCSCGNDGDSKSEQTITFEAFAPHSVSEQTLNLQAYASSGLPLTFTSNNPTVASVSGNTLQLHQAGIVSITATQPGNEEYFKASVTRLLVVQPASDPTKKEQTITFELVSSWKASLGDLTLEAISSSGLPVTYSCSNPELVTITGNVLTLNWATYGATVVVTASQGGDETYNPAPNVSRSIWVEHDTH